MRYLKGKVSRVKISDLWNRSNAETRQRQDRFIKNHKGIDWIGYAHQTGDYMNAMMLGLIGMKEPQYELSLEEIIAAEAHLDE